MYKILDAEGKQIVSPPSQDPKPNKVSLTKIANLKLEDDDLFMVSAAFVVDFYAMCLEVVQEAKNTGGHLSVETDKKIRRLSNTCKAILMPLLSNKTVSIMEKKLDVNEKEFEEDDEYVKFISGEIRSYTTDLLNKVLKEAIEGEKGAQNGE